MPTVVAAEGPARHAALMSLDGACKRAVRYCALIPEIEWVSMVDAVDRNLAQDMNARLAMPPFDQSAMDGYAFAAAAISGFDVEVPVVSRALAGELAPPLPAGAAARVFTGAPIPDGADTVVMQEHVRRHGADIVLDGPPRKGSNIRRRGEDIAADELLLRSGQRLGPHHIALLAAQGFYEVPVRRAPRVVIASTGDELRQPGQSLGGASVYDSNRPMLLALARQAGLNAVDGGCIPDNLGAIASRLVEFAQQADFIVTTGGASMGEADHSAAALKVSHATFETLKMAVRPGKPAIIGRLEKAAYLGLPGNPVAALVSWLTLGNAMIAALSGAATRRLGLPIAVASGFERAPGRTEFAPARLVETAEGIRLEILSRGGSARLKPLIHADGLVEIEAAKGNLAHGDFVAFHPFRGGFSI